MAILNREFDCIVSDNSSDVCTRSLTVNGDDSAVVAACNGVRSCSGVGEAATKIEIFLGCRASVVHIYISGIVAVAYSCALYPCGDSAAKDTESSGKFNHEISFVLQILEYCACFGAT